MTGGTPPARGAVGYAELAYPDGTAQDSVAGDTGNGRRAIGVRSDSSAPYALDLNTGNGSVTVSEA